MDDWYHYAPKRKPQVLTKAILLIAALLAAAGMYIANIQAARSLRSDSGSDTIHRMQDSFRLDQAGF